MNQKIRVTKEFTFEAAHALDGYSGKCKDIHGHSYHLRITVIGEPNNNVQDPDCGMVIDFSDIKDIVKTKILKNFDHRLVLRNDSRFKGLEEKNERVRYVDYQPTCENMLLEMVSTLKAAFTGDVALCAASLRETANSFAEWRREDNK